MTAEPIWNEEAERGVLGAAMLAPSACDEVCGPPLDLQPEDFWQPAHGEIWRTIIDLRASVAGAVDTILVSNALAARGRLAACGGSPYLHTLISADRLHTTANISYHAGIVQRCALLRRIVQAGVRITQLGESGAVGSDTSDIIDFVRREVEDATSERGFSSTAVSISESIWPYVDSLSDPIRGVVPTPWPELDELLNGGLRPGQLTLLCARTSAGKSIAGLNIAKDAARSGIPTTFVSCEMSRDEVHARLIASTGTVSLGSLVSHRVRPEDVERVKRAADRLAGWPLIVDESPGPTAAEIRVSCRSIARDGLGLLVIDQLSFLRLPPDDRAPLRQQLGRIGRELIELAKELRVPVVLIHQLNRGPTDRGNGRPNYHSDIRESDELAHHSHSIIMLWREEDKPGTVTMILGKQRNGPVGEVELGFEGRYARIVSAHSGQLS